MDEYPICRASPDCPLCGHPKKPPALTCYRCKIGFKTIGPDFGKTAFDRFETSPRRTEP